MSTFSIEPIAYIVNNYTDKFGIPRQSNLVTNHTSTIIFHEKFRDKNALRGIEGYSHIWLLWLCNMAVNDNFSPTVRPPRLGGNTRVGVFATRSPFHPNKIGLSCVELICIEKSDKHGYTLKVRGDDLLNGTPIIDIKPYIPFSDSFPNAKGGFADEVFGEKLTVIFSDSCSFIDEDTKITLTQILSQDIRPAYHNDNDRVYKMDYGCYNISFYVEENVLTVMSAKKIETETKA